MADGSGTRTLLFSDIEGSTLLLSDLGEAYGEVLSTHRRLLRDAWKTWRGDEMGTEGDSFFVVFASARDAVSAAVEAQHGLMSASWPGDKQLRVRMGLHTGEPTRYEDGYVGMDVHRAARVAGIAHGGQVVVTDTTAALVRGHLPDGASLRDLGEHRLKDLAVPEHLFQVSAAGLVTEFPPLRSMGTTSSLPRPSTPILGRERDLAALTPLLLDDGARMVTLTGPGGTGKTRLALALADAVAGSFPDGVYFVPLATATTADGMWAMLADRLGLKDATPDRVQDELAPRRSLLVLDNLEQLSAADVVVAALLDRAPALRVVVTSRRPLHLSYEHDYPVPPLGLPVGDELGKAAPSAAVRLFAERAAMVAPRFSLTADNVGAVATICRRLDGLPLAIELTAARSRLLSPQALLARIDTSLDATSPDRDRPRRQRSLRDTIAWSHDLLRPPLREAFRRLGVLPGSSSLRAAEAVMPDGADVLEAVTELAETSLLRVVEGHDAEPRVLLLQTVRDFALEELVVAGEEDDARRRHAAYVLDLLDEVGPRLRGPRALDAVEQLSTESDHVQAALTWTLGTSGPGPSDEQRVDMGLRLCAATAWFWATQGQLESGWAWHARAREVAPDEDSALMARILLWLGIRGAWDVQTEGASAMLREALAMAERHGDRSTMAEAASTLGQWHQHRGDPAAAAEQFTLGLRWATEAGDDQVRASVLHHFAGLLAETGDFDRARDYLDESLAISTRAGIERDVVGRGMDMADLLAMEGRAEEAQAALAALVPDVLRLREPVMSAEVVGAFARVALALGELRDVVVLASARNVFHTEMGWPIRVLDTWKERIDAARQVLGDSDWEAACAEGHAMTRAQALEYAAGRAAVK